MKIQTLNSVAGSLLIVVTISVSLPLTILTIQSGGGTWGFGIFAIAILIPLCFYALFGVAAMLSHARLQWLFFVLGHSLSTVAGIICLVLFPLYPLPIVLIPLVLMGVGLSDRRRHNYYLLLMILLGLAANTVLVKWELDFDRSIPLFQLLGM